MDFNKVEAQAIEKTVNESAENQVLELDELQLAAVGGGIGDVAWS